MYIEELKEVEGEESVENSIALFVSKRALIGVGARALFYPTLLYNVVRNRIQSEFHWWDRVDEFILLGAVPFPVDVPHLKELGVQGVVTLNEPYETLVSTSLYHAHHISHLVIPTRDYLFAPSHGDICQAVHFIHENALCGKTTYVHCKAGRGRSTTVVLCYLVEHKQMTPHAAYEYVRSIRPRVHLAAAQWQAVQDYFHCKKEGNIWTNSSSTETAVCLPEKPEMEAFDDGSVVLVTKSDLDGYEESLYLGATASSNNMLAELRITFASQATIARLSCIWASRYHAGTGGHKMWRKKLGGRSVGSDELESIGVDIQVC